MPTGYLVARFIRFYTHSAWMNPSHPTRDHVVPYAMFYAMLAALPHVAAAEQASAYFAALLAGAQVHGGEEGKAQRDRHVEELLDTAYPAGEA